MPSFRDFYSTAQFQDHIERDAAYRNAKDEKDPDAQVRTDAWLAGLETFDRALAAFLQAKAAAGELPAIAFIEGRGLRWGNAWNRLAAGSAQDDDGDMIVSGMGLGALWSSPGRVRETSLAQAYEDLVRRIDNGERITPSSAYGTCSRTGQTLYVEMDPGWAPRYGTLKGRREFVALTEGLPPRQVHYDTITVPSGSLLLADWFRIETFTEVVDANKPKDSIETEFGRSTLSAYYAREFNFVSVSVGCSPELIERDGHFAVALRKDNEDESDYAEVTGRVVGRIDTSYWWVSAIDEQVLTDIVARKTGAEAAQRLVQEMLQKGDVLRVNVEKGTQLHVYHLHNGGLQNQFQCEAVDDTNLRALFMVLSQQPLQWAPVERKAKAGLAP